MSHLLAGGQPRSVLLHAVKKKKEKKGWSAHGSRTEDVKWGQMLQNSKSKIPHRTTGAEIWTSQRRKWRNIRTPVTPAASRLIDLHHFSLLTSQRVGLKTLDLFGGTARLNAINKYLWTSYAAQSFKSSNQFFQSRSGARCPSKLNTNYNPRPNLAFWPKVLTLLARCRTFSTKPMIYFRTFSEPTT